MEFIETKPLGQSGEKSEQTVWDAIKKVFSDREGFAYWQYPLFTNNEDQSRKYKEPDILIVDRHLGLIIIEVKGCLIHQIENINGHVWKMTSDFYSRKIYPYKQARSHLTDLLRYCDKQDSLFRSVTGRVLVALPQISSSNWNQKGFSNRPNTPPIIFSDILTKKKLWESIENATPVVQGKSLTDKQWKTLLSVVAGSSQDTEENDDATEEIEERLKELNHQELIENLEDQLFKFDLQQEKISKVIPPGPQRIRGIAGSGKSVILCQRAAHFHLMNPEYKIGFIFFTRSLYSFYREQIDRWLRRFSSDEVTLERTNGKIDILHAWGANDEPGFYSQIRDKYDISKILTKKESQQYRKIQEESNNQWVTPPALLGFNCRRFFNHLQQENREIEPIYDAILIDEGQDLVIEEDYKIDDKQPIYWLAWSFLKPISEDEPDMKYFCWAYDEAQSLDILTIPQFAEIFGQGLGQKLSGANTGPTYLGGARKTEIMRCCYRTPGVILTAAHALGMGLLREQGIIREWAITDKQEWDRLGYLVDGGFKVINSKITIRRPPENNGNILSSYDDLSLVKFKKFSSKNAELEFVIDSIKQAINQNNLNPEHNLIVIPLGKQVKQIQKNIASKLQQAGINTYIPGADNINTTSIDDNRSRFWWDQAVTISGIHRSKGNEAYWVFLVGLEQVAMEEKDRLLRNQLFVGMTRTKGWLTMTGISSPDEEEYGLYREIEQALATPNKITFTLKYDNS